MICLQCSHFNLKNYPELAKSGYGTCLKVKRAGYFVSIKNHCEKFRQAESDVTMKRIDWAKKNGMNHGIE